jgi:HD-like signal output (HDOD) protein
MKTYAANPTIPARPPANQDLQALFALGQDVDCSPREWLSVVNRLPVLRQRILQRINASYATVPQPITSLAQAIVNLGFNTVRNLARMATH